MLPIRSTNFHKKIECMEQRGLTPPPVPIAIYEPIDHNLFIQCYIISTAGTFIEWPPVSLSVPDFTNVHCYQNPETEKFNTISVSQKYSQKLKDTKKRLSIYNINL